MDLAQVPLEGVWKTVIVISFLKPFSHGSRSFQEHEKNYLTPLKKGCRVCFSRLSGLQSHKSKTMQKEKRNYTVSKYFAKTISSLFEKAELTSFLKNCLETNKFPRQLKKSPFKILLSWFPHSNCAMYYCMVQWKVFREHKTSDSISLSKPSLCI